MNRGCDINGYLNINVNVNVYISVNININVNAFCNISGCINPC